MHKQTIIYLLLILVVSATLRLYKIQEVPPGVNRDEASIGYTAYSLIVTGRDEYGRKWPLSFESFGDWKLPLYIYATIPFVKLFGLNELAVRLPSALTGIASVVTIYFLVLEFFQASSTKHKISNNHQAPSTKRYKSWNLGFGAWNLPEQVALLSAFVLAVMPWHIHISRVESEAIVATLFVIIGSILFLRKKLILSAVFFAATYWTYHGTHVSTTLLLLGAALIYRKEIIRIRRWWIAVGVGVLLTAGIVSVTISADRTKLNGISIFGDPAVVHAKIELPRLATGHPDALLTRLRYNRVTYAITTFFGNYLASYGPEFLFIKGGGNRAHNIKGYGNLHPIEAPFLLLGVMWLIMNRKKKGALFILWWIAIAAVAPAITKDAPHSNRMLMVVPALAVTVALGMSTFLHNKPLALLCGLGYVVSVTVYGIRYFVDFPKNERSHWGLPYKTLVSQLESPSNRDKKVVISKPETSPYIYILFYSAYPPDRYQTEAKRYPVTPDGFTHVEGFGRYSFRDIHTDTDRNNPDTLIIDL